MRTLKQLRQDARRIFAAGVAAVDPAKAVKRYLRRRGRVVRVGDRRYDLSEYRHLYVVGAGKASGRMARAVEDILGESLESIASGPTAPDASTFSDCLRIIERYRVRQKIPPAVRAFLRRGAKGDLDETPKAADPVFAKVQNVLIGSNRLALQAAKQE